MTTPDRSANVRIDAQQQRALRMECLKLAAGDSRIRPGDTLTTAEGYAAFVLGQDTP